jgi:hypothetical protein
LATLSISNFLSIKKANITIRRINVFIGPQAQGKSVISKLIYFFKEFPSIIFDEASENKDKRQFDSACKVRFEKIFPSYAWEKTSFLIVYDAGSYKICIENERVGSKLRFSIKYSSSVNKSLALARKVFKSSMEYEADSATHFTKRSNVTRLAREAIAFALYKDPISSKVEQLIYIPAGRSFFANLQKSLFSFISTNIPIDFFLKEFGSIYEITRENNFLRRSHNDRPKSVQKLVDALICGSYEYEKGQDWIVGDRGRVGLSHSSSGQQEVLPMAIILSTWPYISSPSFVRSFVIEEPEAHLFPIAQGQVMSLISSAYNSERGAGDFVITTHSPYILTALNNLIQADNAVRALAGMDASDVYQIIPKDQHVRYEDVSAYMVGEGAVTSILDEEYRLIQADAIDGVSEFFSSRFEKLIQLEVNNSSVEVDDLI